MSEDAGDAEELLTAGRFAALTLLSAKALRIYAERGLLVPHRVDSGSGYRYYHPAQVRTGWLIGLLRAADLSLEDIARIVGGAAEAGLRHLDRCAAELERRTEAHQAVLDRARLHLREELPVTPIDPTLQVDRPVLSVLRRMAPEEMDRRIPAEVRRLRETAAAASLAVTGDPFGIFHGPVTADSDGPLEIALPVDGLTDLPGDVRSYRLAGGLAASRYAEGPETWFPEILAVYDEVAAWISDAGRVPVGPPREVWHNAPSDPEPLRLTIVWPYAPRPT